MASRGFAPQPSRYISRTSTSESSSRSSKFSLCSRGLPDASDKRSEAAVRYNNDYYVQNLLQ